MFFQSGDLGSDADVQDAFRNCLAYETVLRYFLTGTLLNRTGALECRVFGVYSRGLCFYRLVFDNCRHWVLERSGSEQRGRDG